MAADSEHDEILRDLTKALESCLRLVRRLSALPAEESSPPDTADPPGLSIAEIEATVIRLGTFAAAAEHYGLSKETLHSRLRKVYGHERRGDQGVSGAMLTRIANTIGIEAAADELGTTPEIVRRWCERRRIPAPARRAIAAAAQRHEFMRR